MSSSTNTSTQSAESSARVQSFQVEDTMYYQLSQTNVFINYLPYHVGREEFVNLVSGFGPHRSVFLSPPNQSSVYFAPMNNLQLNGGYGFVCFFSPEDAAKCVNVLDGLFMYHKQLKVSFARPSGGYTLHIRNLCKSLTEAYLLSTLKQYGNVISARIIYERCTFRTLGAQPCAQLPVWMGMSTGEAYAIYETRDQALFAARQLEARIGCKVRLLESRVRNAGRGSGRFPPYIPPFPF